MKNRDSFAPVPHSVESEDVTTWSLPEGASARFGQGIVETLAFSADGNYLAIGTRIGLWLYEVGTMSPVALWGTERGTWKAAFSPNGKWIAASDWDDNVKGMGYTSRNVPCGDNNRGLPFEVGVFA